MHFSFLCHNSYLFHMFLLQVLHYIYIYLLISRTKRGEGEGETVRECERFTLWWQNKKSRESLICLLIHLLTSVLKLDGAITVQNFLG